MYTQHGKISRNFYLRPSPEVAKDLIGKLLIRTHRNHQIGGYIVETEAYLSQNDLAAHSSRGLTKSNASLFKLGGHTYVHTIHTHNCLDIVCGSRGEAGSVLIRALHPAFGIEQMQKNRGKTALKDLTSGPGKLCKALMIDRSMDGIDVTSESTEISLYDADTIPDFLKTKIITTERIGISKSKELMLRFVLEGSEFVSH